MARDKIEFDVVGRDTSGSKAFKQVGAAAEKAGDQVEDLGKKSATAADQVDDLGDKTRQSGREADDAGEEYAGLAAEIAVAQAAMRDLAAEIDRTGNKDLAKDLRRQQADLRKLTRIKDLLPDDSETTAEAVRFGGRIAAGVASGLSRAGGPISAALTNVFGTLPPGAQVALGTSVVAAASAAAPALGGVIAGAVVGAAGVGGIIGGIAVAAQHPQVKAAAKLTGDSFAEEMRRGAVSFVPATVEALGIVRDGIGEIGDDWERASRAASGMLAPLTRDVLSGATSAVDGFATAVERSGPVVRVLGDIAEDAGELVGETFVQLSAHAYEGSRALTALWGVFRIGVSTIVGTIGALAEAYGWMEKLGALLVGNRTRFAQLVAEEEAAKTSGDGLSQGLQDLIAGFTSTESTAATAAAEVETLSDMIRRLTGENISAEQANIRLEEAIDKATAAGKANNDGIDANTEKGRANRQALLGIAEAAAASSDAILAQTGSQEMASAATERGRAKFIEAARAMGVSKAEANKLADQLFGIPSVNPTVKVTTTQTPIDLKTVAGRIAAIKSKSVVITVHNNIITTRSEGRNVGIGDGIGGRAAGGPTLRGQTLWVGEQGPELLTFRDNGYVLNARQSAEIAGRASASPVGVSTPAASGSGPSTDQLVAAFERAMERALSRTTLRIDDRGGRTADLYVRAG
ncbi:hypothetical protein ACFYL6_20905 [Micromonospora sp. NPDC007208]|uniref:hypothetical protein n=1 Tax=Micromonospora sp. NPDC007208 TaxID=3364236 RepID=UPI0036913538